MADEADSGLLEQPVLMVSTGEGHRRIADLDGSQVGFAEWRWGGWWAGYTLCVHEGGDAPLVFTLRRRWALPTRREVRDAEGERVGELTGRRILDRWGGATMAAEGQGGSTRWHDAQGTLLAEWLRGEGGIRLEFHAALGHDPFARMLLLAAALVAA